LGRMAAAVAPTNRPANIYRGPDDIPVLATTVAAGALVLVTVDKDLLALDGFQGIAIIKTGEFWRGTTD
jgi:predicted nucleic acid-binding protein